MPCAQLAENDRMVSSLMDEHRTLGKLIGALARLSRMQSEIPVDQWETVLGRKQMILDHIAGFVDANLFQRTELAAQQLAECGCHDVQQSLLGLMAQCRQQLAEISLSEQAVIRDIVTQKNALHQALVSRGKHRVAGKRYANDTYRPSASRFFDMMP